MLHMNDLIVFELSKLSEFKVIGHKEEQRHLLRNICLPYLGYADF
jgi:hypothetical protein